jgi:hypothetical protein
MNDRVYDGANLLGIVLIAIGVGMIDIAAAFIIVGVLIIFLTVLGRYLLLWRR